MQINRFPKKFRGRRQILVGVLVRRKIRNQSDHGGFHSALRCFERGAFGKTLLSI